MKSSRKIDVWEFRREEPLMRSAGKEFMEFTKYKYQDESDQSRGVRQPPLELGYDASKPLINLPSPKDLELGGESFIDVINSRKSLRKYSRKPLTIEDLSFLLWCTQGVKKAAGNRATFRTVPSAGARHAFETYILINNVEGLKPGLYRYLALQHKLIETDMSSDISGIIVAGCLGQGFVGLCGATFIWVAVVERMRWRYTQRGYRYLHLDAGHVCQNLYLATEAIDAGACAVGAFDDDALNNALGLDGDELFVIYVCTVGRK